MLTELRLITNSSLIYNYIYVYFPSRRYGDLGIVQTGAALLTSP